MTTSSERHRRNGRGFTLLEVMTALAILGVVVFQLLATRELATRNALNARNANIARGLARQILSELEFRGLDQLYGTFDGYPGFTYEVEVEEINLITGESEEDEKEKEKAAPKAPGDAFDPEAQAEKEAEARYLLRRVRLKLSYPSLAESTDPKPHELHVETVMPALPEQKESAAKAPLPFK